MEFSQFLISKLPKFETLERTRGIQGFMRERKKLYKQLGRLQKELDRGRDNAESPESFSTDIVRLITFKQIEINELEAQIELVAEGI